MKVEIAHLKSNKFMLVGDRPFPDFIDHVEFYKDQRLLMISYEKEEVDDSLMEHEVPFEMITPLSRNNEIIIYSLFADHDPIGYTVPLVQS